MKSFENPLEAYKQKIASEVAELPQVKDHVGVMYRNLIQPEDFDEPVSSYVQFAAKEAIGVIVSLVIENAGVAINPADADFRQTIVSRVDDLLDQSKEMPQIAKVKSELRRACIKTLGVEKPRSPSALIRHFELSFAMFFNVVAQASMYLMNKIDIKYMAMTERELAEFQEGLIKEIRAKGGEVKTVKEGDDIEDALEDPVKKLSDLN